VALAHVAGRIGHGHLDAGATHINAHQDGVHLNHLLSDRPSAIGESRRPVGCSQPCCAISAWATARDVLRAAAPADRAVGRTVGVSDGRTGARRHSSRARTRKEAVACPSIGRHHPIRRAPRSPGSTTPARRAESPRAQRGEARRQCNQQEPGKCIAFRRAEKLSAALGHGGGKLGEPSHRGARFARHGPHSPMPMSGCFWCCLHPDWGCHSQSHPEGHPPKTLVGESHPLPACSGALRVTPS